MLVIKTDKEKVSSSLTNRRTLRSTETQTPKFIQPRVRWVWTVNSQSFFPCCCASCLEQSSSFFLSPQPLFLFSNLASRLIYLITNLNSWSHKSVHSRLVTVRLCLSWGISIIILTIIIINYHGARNANPCFCGGSGLKTKRLLFDIHILLNVINDMLNY